MNLILRVGPYLICVLVIALISAGKLMLGEVAPLNPFVLYLSGIMVCAWYGGLGPGLFGTLLSIVAVHGLHLQSPYPLPWSGTAWTLQTTLFVAEAIVITYICSAMRRSSPSIRAKLEQARQAGPKRLYSELHFARIFESRMIGLLFTDKSGRILDANDYFLELLGYNREAIESGSLTWQAITPSEHRDSSDAAWRDLESHGTVAPFEREYVHRDGRRIAMLSGAAMLDERTSVTFALDISERRDAKAAIEKAYADLERRVATRTQELQDANVELKKLVEDREVTSEQMRQYQQFLDSVIENIPNMIFVKDAKTLKFVRFNRAGEELVGYPRETLIGKSDFDLFPPDQAEQFTTKDREVLEGRSVVDIPEEPLQTTGGLRYLHTKKIPILDKVGDPLYLLGISEDITERREREDQRLKRIQEQAIRAEIEKGAGRLAFLSEASAALNESLDLNTMLDSFAKVIVAHMADWCAIELTPEESDNLQLIVAHRDPEQVNQALEWSRLHPTDWNFTGGVPQVVRTNRPELHSVITDEFLQTLAKSDEQLKSALSSNLKSAMIVPLRSYGQALGAISFFSTESGRTFDKTDLSVAEDLAKRAYFAVQNARLYKKAQEASRAKSAFLANMSHEIRTPLGAMLGFAEVLFEDAKMNPEQVDNISTIIRNGRQLLRIVDEILDLSKVESERVFIEQVEFSLPSLVEDVAALLGHQAKDKGLRFQIRTADRLPDRIISDPTRIRQILLNIIGNAIKFTEKGQIDVVVTLRPRTEGTRRRILEVQIVDSGIGITESQARQLFRPFAQADSSMTRRFGGTGLGLFLSRNLARLLGGDLVLAASSPGHGSTFILTIAIEPVEETRNSKLLSDRGAHNKEVDSVNGKVLVVDDVSDNRILIKHYVNRMGLDVEMASSGEEGLQKILRTPYDVILMDIQMPGMDGVEAVHRLRQSNYHGPVVALTAHAMKGDREKYLNSGFDDYLCKPVTRASLEETLNKYIKPLN